MRELFGIPIQTLAMTLSVVFGVAIALVAIVALRNRVFLRLGVRNVGRRKSRTMLIVVGLMLGTALISAALNTGDTLSHTIRSSVLRSLGSTDEIVALKGVQIVNVMPGAVIDYFDEAKYDDVRAAAQREPLIDGTAPAILETVAVQDTTSRQTESTVGLFATDPQRMPGFGDIERSGGGAAPLGDLAPGEVYLNAKGADKLDAHAGDELTVYGGGKLTTVRVKDVVNYQGGGTDGAGIIAQLREGQQIVGREGKINFILVSNKGGTMSGVSHTDAVVTAMKPAADAAGLEIQPTKQDAVKMADDMGASMILLFTTFGTFSIAAGILLIFLIFVMLAGERKTEMGIARAMGTQRGNLVQMFLFEGVAYDLAAAAVGALLGVAVAYVMVLVMARALADFGVSLEHDLRTESLVIAYTLGVMLTLLVVTVSAWQVSVLNITTAIRNLPDPVGKRGGKGRWVLAGLAWAGAALLIVSGLGSKQAAAFHLGVSLAIIGLVPALRALRAPERLAYSLPGALLVVWWLLPEAATSRFLPEMSADFTIFVLCGLMVVIGATWVFMYNADVVLRGNMWLFGRIRWLAPMLKAAVAYPLRSRFRTGITLAMFTLVVFTLVVMSTIITSVNGTINDQRAFGGGYDVRANTATINPVRDFPAAVRAAGLDPAMFGNSAALSYVPMKVRQTGVADQSFHDYAVRGLDASFLRDNQYEFAVMADGYTSSRQVWDAVAANPDLAVIDSLIVPRRANYNGGPTALDFQLSGFYLEDGKLPPLSIDVRDEQIGTTRTVKVIGILKDTAPYFLAGISSSQQSVAAAYGDRAVPTLHLVKTAPGVKPETAAKDLESAFLANGMEAAALRADLADMMDTQNAFNYILQGFMGLGLIVGVAALGVISARAVVERRQQIGVLRSLGFQQRMVQLTFLLESSFISLTGILVGTVLGIIVSFNVVYSFSDTPGWEGTGLAVPWLNLAVVFGVVYAASLLATFVPARQASRVFPAEALRYE